MQYQSKKKTNRERTDRTVGKIERRRGASLYHVDLGRALPKETKETEKKGMRSLREKKTERAKQKTN
jgi:hypothetical protein